jgi:hypothetical protein
MEDLLYVAPTVEWNLYRSIQPRRYSPLIFIYQPCVYRFNHFLKITEQRCKKGDGKVRKRG